MSTVLDDSGIFDFDQKYVENIKRIKEDPLVISCTIKRLTLENAGAFYNLDDDRIADLTIDQDREMAEQVRKYFAKKFFWQNFTNNLNISSFRNRVCYLLEGRIRDCKDQDIGIYYKLPYFYEEDMIYDDFKKAYNTTEVPQIIYGGHRSRETLNLQYLKSTLCYQRKRRIQRLWFTDQTHLFSIELEDANPLLETFIDSLTSTSNVKLEAYRNIDRIDKMYFYKIYNFKLVKEENA